MLGVAFVATATHPAYQHHRTVGSAEPVTAGVVSPEYDRTTGASSGVQECRVTVAFTLTDEGETHTSDGAFSSEHDG